MSWNPWRDARDLRVELTNIQIASDHLQRQCDLYLDRFDKLQQTNDQLREALTLYRHTA